MIDLLSGTAAFLYREGCYLLMKRAPHRQIVPGLWSGVGGKMEREELNDPYSACLREICEETGIPALAISDLRLRYVILRRSGDTIRQSYCYFGKTTAEATLATDEGELHWIPEAELLQRSFSQTFSAMLHHFVHTPDEQRIIVGVAQNLEGRCQMTWGALEDFDAL